ncbi:MAG: class B sortase [Acidobacteriota bacterium]|nr:class B sortase [Acidobacteriota bacterium]
MLAGAAILSMNEQSRRAYGGLSESVRHPVQGAVEEAVDDTASAHEGDRRPTGINWDTLKLLNPDVAAWVSVEGTDVDLPVMAPADRDMTYYLRHDLWRRWVLAGTPFLDHRSDADGPHRLVYGHHLATGGQFSSLQRAHRQEIFETLGSCVWQTPGEGATSLEPFCALMVDMWYAPIQTFGFDGDAGLRDWLRARAAEATARNAGYSELAEGARSALTLVTCTSDLSHQRWRTLVIFVQRTGAGPP